MTDSCPHCKLAQEGADAALRTAARATRREADHMGGCLGGLLLGVLIGGFFGFMSVIDSRTVFYKCAESMEEKTE